MPVQTSSSEDHLSQEVQLAPPLCTRGRGLAEIPTIWLPWIHVSLSAVLGEGERGEKSGRGSVMRGEGGKMEERIREREEGEERGREGGRVREREGGGDRRVREGWREGGGDGER